MAQAAPNPLGVPTIHHYTFASDYFNDPSKDPYNGSYLHLMSPFLIDINNAAAITPAQVRTSIAAATNNQEALLLCILHNGKTRNYLCPQRFENTVGLQLPPNLVNRIFAFDGDLHRSQGFNVELPNQLFELIGNTVLVPTVAHITAQIAADPNLDIFGPFQAGDANTEVVRSRNSILVPFRYSQYFLAQDGITPKQYFETVYPQLVNDTLDQECTALTQFFQIAFTRSGHGLPSILDRTDIPTASRSDIVLEKRDRLLKVFFPQLDNNLAQLANSGIATAIGNLDANLQQMRHVDERRREAKETKTVESWLGSVRFPRLLYLARAATEQDLAPFWSQIANAKKGDWLRLAQALVDEVLLTLGEDHLTFVVDMALMTVTIGLKWHMEHRDGIEQGLMPFRFKDTDLEAALAISHAVSLVHEGGANPSLKDALETLKSSFILPTTEKSNLYIRRMQVWMTVVLGDQHPIVTFLSDHYRNMESFRFEWAAWRSNNPLLNSRANGVIHLKKVSLGLSYYFKQQALKPNEQDLPRYDEISHGVLQELHWEPNLSQLFITKYKLVEMCQGVSGDRSSDNLVGTGAGQGTGSAPRPGNSGGASQLAGGRVANLQYNGGLFEPFKTRNVKTKLVRALIRDGKIQAQPPSKVDGEPMCLAWHTIGVCNVECPRKADHVHYTEEEYKSDAGLETWCTQCYPTDTASAEKTLRSSE